MSGETNMAQPQPPAPTRERVDANAYVNISISTDRGWNQHWGTNVTESTPLSDDADDSTILEAILRALSQAQNAAHNALVTRYPGVTLTLDAPSQTDNV